MIKSMTGYGKGQHTENDRKFTIEIRSVNNRYNDITIKLPRFLNPFEERIRKQLAMTISRGKVEVFVQFETFAAADVNIKLNRPLADAYFAKLVAISREYNLIPPRETPNILDMISNFPDIIEIDKSMESTPQDEIWQTLSIALDEAITHFLDMRRREGEALKADLLEKINKADGLVYEISESVPQIQESHREKLKVRIEEVLKDIVIDEQRLLNEVAFYADKYSVDEELIRLGSHISQFKEILNESIPIGKKMDFVVQEMVRETNTLGAKANDVAISRNIIQLKSEIEKIREQIQNIE